MAIVYDYKKILKKKEKRILDKLFVPLFCHSRCHDEQRAEYVERVAVKASRHAQPLSVSKRRREGVQSCRFSDGANKMVDFSARLDAQPYAQKFFLLEG